MIPDPLHPAIVHFPVVLAVALPAVAVGVLLFLRKRGPSRGAWALVAGLALLTAGVSWLALKTGEEQEEVVEEVVARQPLHAHEEAAEVFLGATVLAAALSLAGLLGGTLGGAARGATVVAALAVLVAGYRVGHSGGELVYRYGAAQAYVDGAATRVDARTADRVEREDDDDRR